MYHALFKNRREAGQRLGEAFEDWRGRAPLVLALPRGGVPVGFEIARHLDAPLNVLLVRKIGTPGNPELAAGAVVEGEDGVPEVVWNARIVAALGLSPSYLEAEKARQMREIDARRARYRLACPAVALAGKAVIVVDDGIATGATVKVALSYLRHAKVAALGVAMPVAPLSTWRCIAPCADHAACLHCAADLNSVGEYYQDFAQVSDEEVLALLRAAATG